MITKDTTLTIRISKKTKDEFARVAFAQRRTPSAILDELIKRHIEKYYKLLNLKNLNEEANKND